MTNHDIHSPEYNGPSMKEAMLDLLDGFEEILEHNRTAHPEHDMTGALSDFDQMTKHLRAATNAFGIEDNPTTWEAVMAGFLLGAEVLANAGPIAFARKMAGEPATSIPEMLAYSFAIAERWKTSGDTTAKDILAALEADG